MKRTVYQNLPDAMAEREPGYAVAALILPDSVR
jgi:hypothetical protein